jgi:starvation-inducible DNA-binding protein
LIQSEHSVVDSVDTTLPEAIGWNRSTAHATIKVKRGCGESNSCGVVRRMSFRRWGGNETKEAGMAKTEAKETHVRTSKDAHVRERLGTPTDLKSEATRDISAALAGLLADVFALYMKTKNFHWHMSGPHFRDYHLLLDEHGDQIFAMTDPMAERARKIGGTTLRSVGDISRKQRILDNDADYVDPKDMLAELRDDNKALTASLRAVHNVCDDHGDVATASLLEVWIDETERRTWFLFEATRGGPGQND